MNDVELIFHHMPKAMPLYLRGLLERRGRLRPDDRLPAMKAVVKGFSFDPQHLGKVARICGFTPGPFMPPFYPLSFLFPLHMSIITHKRFPFFYPSMLHVRDHVFQHRRVRLDDALDISCEINSRRTLPKGLEFDLHTVMSSSGSPLWEGISTNFFPGRFGEPDQRPSRASFEPINGDHEEMEWIMPATDKFRFGLLSSDYNGIHYSASYAKIMGFSRDFAHSQRSLAECLRRLIPVREDLPVRLDVALKGPVYYGSSVLMKLNAGNGGRRFDLFCAGNPRPCLSGSLRNVSPGAGFHEKDERITAC